jgi:citrate lyase beta subunit
VSDLYKDAYGFRPGADFWSDWKNASNKTKQKVWDDLLIDLEHSIERDRADAARAAEEFLGRIEQMIEYGAADYETALRWIVDAEGPFDDDQDIEHFVWKQGLLCCEFGRQLVKDIKGIM